MSHPEPEAKAEPEPDAKLIHTKRLYRAMVEAVHRLDVIVSNKMAYWEVFKPENISLRNKDVVVGVWCSLNGERLGTCGGHDGAVRRVDVGWETGQVLAGSADNSCRLWDCGTGSSSLDLK